MNAAVKVGKEGEKKGREREKEREKRKEIFPSGTSYFGIAINFLEFCFGVQLSEL